MISVQVFVNYLKSVYSFYQFLIIAIYSVLELAIDVA